MLSASTSSRCKRNLLFEFFTIMLFYMVFMISEVLHCKKDVLMHKTPTIMGSREGRIYAGLS